MRRHPTGFHHLALRVKDVGRSLAFYSGVLGLPEVRRNETNATLESAWLRVGPSLLMVERRLKGRGPASGSGHLVAFRVGALGPWRKHLARSGVKLDGHTDYTLYFRDPDGHRVGLSAFPRLRTRKDGPKTTRSRG
jgi:catechol 2,3-dioxygenase-like lactoylglutathione lyase family enzyme